MGLDTTAFRSQAFSLKVKDAETLPTLLIGEIQLLGNFSSYYCNRFIDVKQTPDEAQFAKIHTMKEAN